MIQYWEIWLTGDRKGYLLQKIERVLETKAIGLTETTGTWENQKINVVKFSLELQSKNFERAFFESSVIGEKLHHSWSVAGVSDGKIIATCQADYFAISEIKYANWQLSKTNEIN